LPLCPKCEKVYSGDPDFCPYCGFPHERKKRGFITKTVAGPGGFRADEIPEYLTRKSEAIGYGISGFAAIGLGLLISLAGGGAIGIPILILGFVLIAYGSHYWSKVTHIMWTRQALREYEASSIIEEKSKKICKFCFFLIDGDEPLSRIS